MSTKNTSKDEAKAAEATKVEAVESQTSRSATATTVTTRSTTAVSGGTTYVGNAPDVNGQQIVTRDMSTLLISENGTDYRPFCADYDGGGLVDIERTLKDRVGSDCEPNGTTYLGKVLIQIRDLKHRLKLNDPVRAMLLHANMTGTDLHFKETGNLHEINFKGKIPKYSRAASGDDEGKNEVVLSLGDIKASGFDWSILDKETQHTYVGLSNSTP